jgi:hypothetical protein
MDKLKNLLALGCVLLTSVTYCATTSGNAYLDNTSDHSGIEIHFYPKSPSAIEKSTLSLSDGSFSIIVVDGVYDITYSKTGFQDIKLFDVFLSNNQTLTNRTLSSKPVINVSGDVSGSWTSDYVYKVIGSLSVPAATELIIDPGTLIEFTGFYSLTVNGKLTSIGTKGNPIKWTSNKVNKQRGDWSGIFVNGSQSDTTKIVYSIIEYGGNSSQSTSLINVNGNAEVNNCLIRGSAIGGLKNFNGYVNSRNNEITDCYYYGFSSNESARLSLFEANKVHHIDLIGIVANNSTVRVIRNNWIYNTGYNGISVWGNTLVEGNICFNNPYGIFVTGHGTIVRSNTLLWNNHGIGVYDNDFYQSDPDVSSNIIAFNTGYGIHCPGVYKPKTAQYNLFYGNGSGSANKGPVGFGQIVTNNNGYPSDTYYNIFVNPNFTSTNISDAAFVYLGATSPAIDGGEPTLFDEDGSRLDIGARPHLYDQPSPFKLLLPSNSTVLPTNSETINFKWSKSATTEPLKYEFTLFDVKQSIQKTEIIDTVYSLNWKNFLQQNSTYKWRVKAYNKIFSTTSDTLTFTTPNLPPSKVILINPANESTNAATSMKFTWTQSADDVATTYDLKIYGTDIDISVGELKDTAYTYIFPSSAKSLDFYHWKVVASDGLLTSVSEERSFKLNTPPASFRLIAPSANTIISTDVGVAFKWRKATDNSPVSYTLVIKATNFEYRISSISDTTYLITWPGKLKQNIDYSWAVIASDGQLETRSDENSFSTPNLPPGRPKIITPLTNSTLSTLLSDLSISWNKAKDDDQITYTGLVLGHNLQKTVYLGSDTAGILDWPHLLLQNSNYKFIVFASDGRLQSVSDTIYFRTGNLAPTAFTLVTPFNAAEIIDNSPLEFKWNKAVDDAPVKYQLEIEGDNWRASYLNLPDTTYTLFWNKQTLLPGKQFFWSVKASDGNLVTDSNNHSFRMSITLGVPEGQNESVWPNPFTDVLNFSKLSHIHLVSILDAKGVEVYHNDKIENTIDLSHLRSGLYIVRIYDEQGGLELFRIIKM